MASNIRDGSNYLDGIPVKISKQFLPPKPVTLPQAIDTKTPTDLLSVQYDFSLERNVVECSQKRQSELSDAKLKAAQNGANSKSSSISGKPSAQRVIPWQPDTILQPQQPPEKTSTESSSKNANTKINLSDFENDTSSPFDYMELQTINDLEELNSVFQGIRNEDSVSPESSLTSAQDPASAVAKSMSFPFPQNSWEASPKRISSSLSEDFATSVLSGPRSNSLINQSASPENSSEPKDGVVAKSVSFPLPRHPWQGTSQNASGGLSEGLATDVNDVSRFESSSSSVPRNRKDFFCDNTSFSTLSQVPYIPTNAGGSSEKASSLRGSKSYTDIRRISEIEVVSVTRERSCTPPTFCSEVTESMIKSLPLNEDHFRTPPNESSNGVLHRDDSAYEELDEAAKHFVDCITEMGFVKGQVARAVKHLGVDEKKVVEHLCQIQALEESGYESSEAEAALHLHDYNREQAKEFLDLVNQLTQDLGFEKDKVKKALVQNKNDYNKTIDALLH